MTASHVHGITPGFQWRDGYQTTLESIADTDEVQPDLDWPPLKDAIKYKIKQALSSFSTSPPALLHPAAALIPLIQNANDGALFGETSYSTSSSSENPSSYQTGAAAVAGEDQNSDADGQSAVPRAPTGSAASAASSVSALASSTAGSQTTAADSLASRFTAEVGSPDGLPLGHGVSPADAQGFFPSKSQPPPGYGGSWGRRLSDEQLEREQALVFGMLDEFDTQPPFTIQRLAELAVRPMQFQKTRAKYLSALQRVLSVTATRDAFPISPSFEPVSGDNVNLVPDMMLPPIASGAVDELPSPNGAGTVRPRSQSASSTSSARSQASVERHIEPLFSPIPFLIRDAGEEQGAAGAQAAVQKALEEVPEMELGGADRTRTDGVEVADTAAETTATMETGASSGPSDGSQQGGPAPHPTTGVDAADSALAPSSVATEPGSSPATASTSAAAGDLAHSHSPSGGTPIGLPLSSPAASGSTATAASLPAGRVDEVDTPDAATVPLSATTQLAAHPAEEVEEPRQVKRIRSDRDLSALAAGEEVAKRQGGPDGAVDRDGDAMDVDAPEAQKASDDAA